MNAEQLKRGNELVKVIETTRKALDSLVTLASKREVFSGRDDGQYHLIICEHSDGSGTKADLRRSNGNAELLDTIISAVEKQLSDFEKEFEVL